MNVIDRIRNAEPDWLATKRKAIVPPLVGALVALATRVGIHLDPGESDTLVLIVTAVVTWAIPNRHPVAVAADGGPPAERV